MQWPHDDGACPPDALVDCLRDGPGGLADLPDVRLDDPLRARLSPFEPLPVLRGHSGYMADPTMWRTVESLARHLGAASGTAPPGRPPVAGAQTEDGRQVGTDGRSAQAP